MFLFALQGLLTASCPPCHRTRKVAAHSAAQVSMALMLVCRSKVKKSQRKLYLPGKKTGHSKEPTTVINNSQSLVIACLDSEHMQVITQM